MPLAEVKQLPNLNDVPGLLRRLADTCEADGVTEVATVCFRKGEIDVRGLGGDCGPMFVTILLQQAIRFLEPLIEARLKGEI